MHKINKTLPNTTKPYFNYEHTNKKKLINTRVLINNSTLKRYANNVACPPLF